MGVRCIHVYEQVPQQVDERRIAAFSVPLLSQLDQ